MESDDLASMLKPFGVTADTLVRFDAPLGPEHVDHLDLHPQGTKSRCRAKVDAVVEMSGRPVLYVVRGPQSPEQIQVLRHILMQRGAADHLAVLKPGVLTVYPVVSGAGERRPRKLGEWQAAKVGSRGVIPDLTWGRTGGGNTRGAAKSLHDGLLKLLKKTTDAIIATGVGAQDALSLVGRALFFRFLMDRQILSDRHVKSICPEAPRLADAMSEREHIQKTSSWLHRTFNGNFLLLGKAKNPEEEAQAWPHFWRKPGSDGQIVCRELSNLLHKTDERGQYSFAWNTLDFGHVPVGLLSQVYEAWYHEHAPQQAKRDGVWYTPRAIAEYLTAEAFFGLSDAECAEACVLDPSVGAGVFLVTAFRNIVAAQWRLKGTRPDRSALRGVLYRQLVGFDVNESALRLAALSLYLTVLELDPHPHPAQALRFEDLRAIGVLCDVRSPDDRRPPRPDLPLVGSLGPHLSTEHKHKYDIVLGNPPWTAWASKDSRDPLVQGLRHTVEGVIGSIVRERLEDREGSFEMIDNNPDLAFLWRALEWAKPGTGIIALALHARLLFKTTRPTVAARSQIFRAMTVTGVLNGAALSQTKVWPSQEAPFCLWFALNRTSRPGEGFRFVSPLVDEVLNDRGHIRIDPQAVHPVFPEQVNECSSLLKTLFRGTSLDVAIVDHLRSATTNTLEEIGVVSTRGYQAGGLSRRRASHLVGLPRFGSEQRDQLTTARIQVEGLVKFDAEERVSEPRNRKGKQGAFKGPLVLYPEAPRHDLGAPRALWCETGLAYDNSLYGFSAASHADADALSRYVLIILNSRVALYYALMTSSMFGAERKRLDLSDLRSLPVSKLEDLPASLLSQVHDLSEAILNTSELPCELIDRFTGQLYGLSKQDLRVIEDTISVALPFRESYTRAQRRPTSKEVEDFVAGVRNMMGSILQHMDRGVDVQLIPEDVTDPWIWLIIKTWSIGSSGGEAMAVRDDVQEFLPAVKDLALDTGVSRILLFGECPGSLQIGIFSQYRYFTRTQARILSLDLLSNAESEVWLRGGAS